MDKIWKEIPGYEGYYEVCNSDKDRIRSLNRKSSYEGGLTRNLSGKLLIPQRNGEYTSVTLYKESNKNVMFIHKLKALVFIPNPENKPQVNHKDGNKLNNALWNLEWATGSENTKHAIDTGLLTINKGVDSHRATITENDVQLIRKLFKSGVRPMDIHRQTGIGYELLKNICYKKAWKSLPEIDMIDKLKSQYNIL